MNKYFGEWYFEDIISKINEFKLGTKIKSETGDIYNLSQAEGEGSQKKFSRWNGTKLRFMTYENIGKKFEILEDNTEEIEELYIDTHKILSYDREESKGATVTCFKLIIDEINRLKVEINQLRKDKSND